MFCEQVLRPTAFQTVNANDFGDYFGGLPADCTVTDDLNIPVGAVDDPNVEAALTYFATGGCPVVFAPNSVAKSASRTRELQNVRHRQPHRELADVF